MAGVPILVVRQLLETVRRRWTRSVRVRAASLHSLRPRRRRNAFQARGPAAQAMASNMAARRDRHGRPHHPSRPPLRHKRRPTGGAVDAAIVHGRVRRRRRDRRALDPQTEVAGAEPATAECGLGGLWVSPVAGDHVRPRIQSSPISPTSTSRPSSTMRTSAVAAVGRRCRGGRGSRDRHWRSPRWWFRSGRSRCRARPWPGTARRCGGSGRAAPAHRPRRPRRANLATPALRAVSRNWRTTIGTPATLERRCVSTSRTASCGVHRYISASFEPSAAPSRGR